MSWGTFVHNLNLPPTDALCAPWNCDAHNVPDVALRDSIVHYNIAEEITASGTVPASLGVCDIGNGYAGETLPYAINGSTGYSTTPLTQADAAGGTLPYPCSDVNLLHSYHGTFGGVLKDHIPASRVGGAVIWCSSAITTGAAITHLATQTGPPGGIAQQFGITVSGGTGVSASPVTLGLALGYGAFTLITYPDTITYPNTDWGLVYSGTARLYPLYVCWKSEYYLRDRGGNNSFGLQQKTTYTMFTGASTTPYVLIADTEQSSGNIITGGLEAKLALLEANSYVDFGSRARAVWYSDTFTSTTDSYEDLVEVGRQFPRRYSSYVRPAYCELPT